MRSSRLTQSILLAAVFGSVLGFICQSFYPRSVDGFAQTVEWLPAVFLRLIKSFIGPLVFSTLVVGVAKMGDLRTMGRVGMKALGWFFVASVLSLFIGLLLVNLFEPGKVLHFSLPNGGVPSEFAASALTVQDFVARTVPVSIADALARNEVLQIVVFSVIFGVAAAALGERNTPVVKLCDAVSQIMLKMTGYIVMAAPLAVLGALAGMVARHGLGIVSAFGAFIVEFYAGVSILWAALIAIGILFLGRRAFTLIRRLREPVLLAFSTASSEAAYAKTLEQLEHFGCRKEVAAFLLAIGYSFNLDGSMMYCAFAAVFLAQAYGIALSGGQEIMMLAILMLASKGMAGVPRASLMVLATTLPQFKIPESGIMLLFGIDHFLDMGRSATNVVGNGIAVAVVSSWEEKRRV